MKKLQIITLLMLVVFVLATGFAQRGTYPVNGNDTSKLYSGSMETGYWKYLLDTARGNGDTNKTYVLNSSERIIYFLEDEMWNKMDSLLVKLKRKYPDGENLVSFKSKLGKKPEQYFLISKGDTLHIISKNLAFTGDKPTSLYFYLSEGATFYIEEYFNDKSGSYFMSGEFRDAETRSIIFLNRLLNPG